jgi:hypothetical protein
MDEQETIRAAMQILGRSKSPRKLEALAENRAKLSTEESREKQRTAQAARRERERVAKGDTQETGEKRSPGRPRTTAAPDPTAPKRGPGRPRKQTIESQKAAQDGTGAPEGANTHG